MHGIFGKRERAHNDCISISHPSLFTTGTLEPRTWEKGIYRLDQVSKSAANASEETGVLSLARFYIDMTACKNENKRVPYHASWYRRTFLCSGVFSGLIQIVRSYTHSQHQAACEHFEMLSDKMKRRNPGACAVGRRTVVDMRKIQHLSYHSVSSLPLINKLFDLGIQSEIKQLLWQLLANFYVRGLSLCACVQSKAWKWQMFQRVHQKN